MAPDLPCPVEDRRDRGVVAMSLRGDVICAARAGNPFRLESGKSVSFGSQSPTADSVHRSRAGWARQHKAPVSTAVELELPASGISLARFRTVRQDADSKVILAAASGLPRRIGESRGGPLSCIDRVTSITTIPEIAPVTMPIEMSVGNTSSVGVRRMARLIRLPGDRGMLAVLFVARRKDRDDEKPSAR